jgi:hypothetical protein
MKYYFLVILILLLFRVLYSFIIMRVLKIRK